MKPPSTSAPRVRIVTVHYNSGPITLDCIRSLLATRWPKELLEIVLVDNASRHGIAARVRTEFPQVRVIESPTNVGFAGGCNLGLRDLGTVEYVALVNNDAAVDPNWLEPLVRTLEADPSLGAACPKILFNERFREIHLTSTTTRRGRGDRRQLGVRVSGARIGEDDVWRRVQFVAGAWEYEHGGAGEPSFRWLGHESMLRLPDREGTARLRLAGDGAAEVTVRSGTTSAVLRVNRDPQWYDIPLAPPALDVVNNAGCELALGALGADRGLYDADGVRYAHGTDVFAWCGAAVLMPVRYFEDIGVFDERLFLYSEDFELAWRGRERGWRYQYVPESIVRHVHTASSVDGSNLKLYYDGRNQLLVALRHAPPGAAAKAVIRYSRATASRALRDIMAPLLSGRRPSSEAVTIRIRALGSFARLAPAMIRERARLRPPAGR
ncbi:MAG: glycosyltransferase [Acidimicrobiia bacterium]